MGQSSSAPGGPDGGSAKSADALQPGAEKPVVDFSLPAPVIRGVDGAEKQKLVLKSKLAARLADALPPSCKGTGVSNTSAWYLLFSSEIHGKSFQRLAQLITSQGPTVIAIKILNSPRVIGAFCESEWLTVADREKSAKSAAAAAARAAREGHRTQSQPGPKNQNNVFFGSDNCFVFRAYQDADADVGDDGELFRSHPSMNSNFMYLFDTHSSEDKIGIGMGGQPRYFGWFVDRWLESGACYGARCTTFQSPRLSPTESWKVENVEVYAVKPDIVERLARTGNEAAVGGVSCVNGGTNSKADQMLLELNGTHEFNRRDRTEC